jgi:hypothetical protein
MAAPRPTWPEPTSQAQFVFAFTVGDEDDWRDGLTSPCQAEPVVPPASSTPGRTSRRY